VVFVFFFFKGLDRREKFKQIKFRHKTKKKQDPLSLPPQKTALSPGPLGHAKKKTLSPQNKTNTPQKKPGMLEYIFIYLSIGT
jgi:hypothetical protein